MSNGEREKMQHELLEALHQARKQVESLEAALAHNAAFLGTGIERAEKLARPSDQDSSHFPSALLKYLDLVEPGEDISDFLGREGHDESRPRLGPDAPDSVKPNKAPLVSPLVGELALDHPMDDVLFGAPTDEDADASPDGQDTAPPHNEAAAPSSKTTAAPSDKTTVAPSDTSGLAPSDERAAASPNESSGIPSNNASAAPSNIEATIFVSGDSAENHPLRGVAHNEAAVFPAAESTVPPAEGHYALFNSMEDGFVLFDNIPPQAGGTPEYTADEFVLVLFNPAFRQMFALSPRNQYGMRISEIAGKDAHYWADCLRRVLKNKRPVVQSLRSASGKHYELSAYSPEHGRIACIVKDVTEIQKIEQEIRLNEARLAALHRLSHMDAAPEEEVVRFSLEQAVKLTGSAHGYLYLRRRDEEDTGRLYWSREGIADAGDREPKEQNPSPRNASGGYREITGAEVVSAARGGFSEEMGGPGSVTRYMLSPVVEDGSIVCLAGVADKKDDYSPADLRQLDLFLNGMWFHLRRRWAVEDLRKAKEQAEAANRAKSEFLANVSHELRTPLNGILGMMQILQQSPLNAEQVEWVRTASLSGKGLLRILSDILDFSRIEAGLFTFDPQPFDFAATIRSTLGLFSLEVEQKRLDLSVHIDPGIPQLLLGDDARIRQIVFNLIGNSFKFTSEGCVSLYCARLPRCRKGKCCIYMSISDTGIGIPEEKIADIFRAFTQLDGSSTRRNRGTGLGLAIVQRLVKLMGGSISVESEPGVGTAVHCSLPFDTVDENSLAVDESAPVSPEPREHHPLPLSLLVVEDDPVNLFTLRILLQKAGYDPKCVCDGKQALEALLIESFDCVITDIQMPVMDGVELVRKIRLDDTADIEITEAIAAQFGYGEGKPLPARRHIPPEIPVVALTAYAMSGDKERFLQMGMDYYLSKPINAESLMATLAHIGRIVHARGKVVADAGR